LNYEGLLMYPPLPEELYNALLTAQQSYKDRLYLFPTWNKFIDEPRLLDFIALKFINKEFPIDEFGYYVVYGADIDIFSGYIPRGLIGYENYEIEMALRVFINIDFIIDFKPYSFKGRNISVIWISKKDKIIHPNNIKQYSDKNP
jgi:hypothetical protein